MVRLILGFLIGLTLGYGLASLLLLKPEDDIPAASAVEAAAG